MKIENLELTNEEMNQAIAEFLRWRGLNVEVADIQGKGYPRRSWQVDLKTELNEMAPPPMPSPVDSVATEESL